MNENPFLEDVEDLFDGDLFAQNLNLIPTEIVNLIAPDFAIRFEIVPVAFDSSGTLYLVTTEENFLSINLFTTYEVQNFLSELLNLNCRILIADKQNIQFALNKFYNFSDENLRRAFIKFYHFERLTFNDFDEVVNWARKTDGKVLKKSLIESPVSDSVLKVLKFVPEKIAVKFCLIPVQLSGNVLVLVTSSSRTFDEVKNIATMLKIPCRIFLTLDENIRDALEKFYHLNGLNKKISKKTDFDFFTDGNFIDYKLLDRVFDKEILDKVPFDVAIKFSVVPLDFDCDDKLVLVTKSFDSVLAKKKISELLNFDCKILMTDVDSFSDALNTAYNLSEILSEPDGEWANLRWKFLIAYQPIFLLDLKNSGDYDNYFKNFQTDSVDKLNLMIEQQLRLENISADNVGLVANVRSQCREILIAQICSL